MDKIFLVSKHTGDEERYVEVIRGFGKIEAATDHRNKLEAALHRRNELVLHARRHFADGWAAEHERPAIPDVPPMPKWKAKNGSKKNAAPEVLAEFQAEETRVNGLRQVAFEWYNEAMTEFNAKALAASRRSYKAVGATDKEVEALTEIISHVYIEYATFEVSEVPFDE